jgi:plasmid stabilization system protein ParE
VALGRFTERALADLDRIFDFVARQDPRAPGQAGANIIDATAILTRHPLIGRPVERGLRELVISQGRTGYVALYRFIASSDRVDVLAIRHQREAGFR